MIEIQCGVGVRYGVGEEARERDWERKRGWGGSKCMI